MSVPDVAYVRKQHGEVAQAQSLLLVGQSQFGNGPDKCINYRVQEPKQLVPTLQLLGRLWGGCAQICNTQHEY